MKAKKSLGQNFLKDEKVINKIVNSFNCNNNDLIIEIGPGMGALTKKLKNKNSYLLCYELDTDMKVYLDKLIDNKTNIIFKDILKTNIKDDIKNIKYNKLYIVGNLPYYITSPIIKYIINLELEIEEMIFMVQDEVADRFSSKPGSRDYGYITLLIGYFYHVEKLFKVSKNSFNPIPKVDSAIIKLSKRNEKLDVDKNKYFKLIEDSFKMKRKTLKNNLSNYDFNIINKVLIKHGLNEKVRAEELGEEIFIDIVNELEK